MRQQGRSFHTNETLDHLDGVNDDDRPENLELWVRPQPSGIRASDSIAWVREIVARYDGADLNSSNNAQTGA